MIAFISAPDVDPARLYLCSLSPYFKEDIPTLKNWWKTYMGKRRMNDFAHHKAKAIAKEISCPTRIFCGEAESKKFPTLLKRCEQAERDIKNAQLVIPENAPHEINFPSYVTALKAHIK